MTCMIYKSKIDFGVVVFTFGLTMVAVLPFLLISFSVLDLLLPTILLIFLIDLFCNTKYIICDKKLVITCGSLIKERYEILSIRQIAKTKSWESAPALSLDRIRIIFKDGKSVLVSPKDKKFIETLCHINKNIELLKLHK